MKEILFRSNGGLGKQISATIVAKQLRFKYPDAIIHVQTSYPDPFYNLNVVNKYYPMNPIPYFYDEHKNFEIVETEPYLDMSYRNGEKHLVDVWCERLGLEIPKEKAGQLLLDDEEKAYAKSLALQLKLDRPLVAIQIAGGTSHYEPQKANDPFRTKHYRDLKIEIAQELVNKLVQSGIGAVLQIRLPTEPKLENCLHLPDNEITGTRRLFAILDMCKYGIFIDSFCQHAWAALGKSNAIVLWGGTNPANLGYLSNKNLINKKSCDNLHCNRPNTFVHDFVGNGTFWKCPFSAKCMDFSSERIMSNFQTIVEEEKKKEEAQTKPKKVHIPEVI